MDQLVELVAARGHAGYADPAPPVIYDVALELACGVTLPVIEVTVGYRLLLGGVSLAIRWAGTRLLNVRIESFFDGSAMTAEFRAQAASTGRRPAHLMMLLVDELVYRIHKLHGLARGFGIELDDAFRRTRGQTPFAIYGRHQLRGNQDSRWLEWQRGAAYYVTFGFWPMGETPEDYMERMRWVARPGEVVGPNDVRYAHTLMELAHQGSSMQLKSMPPVLPGPGPGGLRRFADIEAYYEQVIVVGFYGAIPTPTRPTAQQTTNAATGALFAALDRGDARAALSALAQGAETLRHVEYWMDDEPDAARLAADSGLVAVVAAIQRARGARGAGGEGVEAADDDTRANKRARVDLPTVWRMPKPNIEDRNTSDGAQHVAAGGRTFRVHDAQWLPPGLDDLIAAGFVPDGVDPTEFADGLQRIAACRAVGPVVMPDHAQFTACAQTAAMIREWLDRPWRAARTTR